MGDFKFIGKILFSILIASFTLFPEKGFANSTQQTSDPAFLTYNQLIRLPSQLRKNYLLQLQNYSSQLEQVLRASKKKKNSSAFFQLMAIPEAEAVPPDGRLCMNLGFFKPCHETGGSSSFDTNGLVSNEKLAPSCEQGSQMCSPFVFGPGICVSTNNTDDCIRESQSSGPEVGLIQLNKNIDLCAQSKPENIEFCTELKNGINQFVDNLSSVCSHSSSNRSSDVICKRSSAAFIAIRKQYEKLENTQLPEARSEGNCRFVMSPEAMVPTAQDCGSLPPYQYCVGVVSGCPSQNEHPELNITYSYPPDDGRSRYPVLCQTSNHKCEMTALDCLKNHKSTVTFISGIPPRAASSGQNKNKDETSPTVPE